MLDEEIKKSVKRTIEDALKDLENNNYSRCITLLLNAKNELLLNQK